MGMRDWFFLFLSTFLLFFFFFFFVKGFLGVDWWVVWFDGLLNEMTKRGKSNLETFGDCENAVAFSLLMDFSCLLWLIGMGMRG